MIVYNVKRSWFAMKSDAERYRIAEGLPPSSTAKVEVGNRDELTELLNALCEARDSDVAPTDVINRAFVPVENEIPDCVPDFLIKSKGLSR